MSCSALGLNHSISRGTFIEGMRDVSSSVTIVTTNGPEGRHGATVNAFCSVSADPPTVLVCLHASSRIARLVRANGQYCVNVVPEGSQFIANRFAGMDDSVIADRFQGIDLHHSMFESPIVKGSTAFCCYVTSVVRQSSHLVFFGCVSDTIVTGSTPQTYLAGNYRKLERQDQPFSSGGNQACQ